MWDIGKTTPAGLRAGSRWRCAGEGTAYWKYVPAGELHGKIVKECRIRQTLAKLTKGFPLGGGKDFPLSKKFLIWGLKCGTTTCVMSVGIVHQTDCIRRVNQKNSVFFFFFFLFYWCSWGYNLTESANLTLLSSSWYACWSTLERASFGIRPWKQHLLKTFQMDHVLRSEWSTVEGLWGV